MEQQFRPEIQHLRRPAFSQLGFVLSEVGNTFGRSKNDTYNAELASSLAAAVWTVDWMLYAMTMVSLVWPGSNFLQDTI